MSKKEPLLATHTPRASAPKTYLLVHGGLHYMRDNPLPHFSLTGEQYERGHNTAAGCLHEDIMAAFPQFADLAALHLSDIDGVPMHAIENAKYHAGLSGKYSDRKPEVLQRHLRCSDQELALLMGLADSGQTAAFCNRVEAMRPRWAKEARDCIVRHNLTVFGDPWVDERGRDVGYAVNGRTLAFPPR